MTKVFVIPVTDPHKIIINQKNKKNYQTKPPLALNETLKVSQLSLFCGHGCTNIQNIHTYKINLTKINSHFIKNDSI